jgi:hypothetical protein
MFTITRSLLAGSGSSLGTDLLEATALTIIGRLTTSSQIMLRGTNGLGSTRWNAMADDGESSPMIGGALHCSSRVWFSTSGRGVAACYEDGGEAEEVAKDQRAGSTFKKVAAF